MTRYTSEFEEFWLKYPTRWNRDLGISVKRKKKPAFIKWQQLSQEIRRECLRKVTRIKSAEGGSVRDCVTWLNQEGWDDIDLPSKKVETILPKELTDKALKDVPGLVNVNNARNRNMDILKRS